MKPKSYSQWAESLGIARGALADGETIDASPGHTPLAKEPSVFHRHVGERLPAPEMEAMTVNHESRTTASAIKKWWRRLSPQERRRYNAQRAQNARSK